MLPNNFVLLGHLIFTSIMTGVIWVIQIVHYPSFHFIEKESYTAFQKFHMNSISLIVVPVMILELATGVLLLAGNSKNILKVIKKANKLKINTISLLGKNGGAAKKLSKNNIIVKSNSTARIQAAHICIGHILMELIEDNLLNEKG